MKKNKNQNNFYYKIPIKFYFGAATVLIQEIIFFSKKNNLKRVYLNIISKNKVYKNYFKILKYLNTNISISFNKRISNNSINVKKKFKKKNVYDFDIINKLYILTNKFPLLNFKKSCYNKVKFTLKKKSINIKKSVAIHIKINKYESKKKHINFWKKVINYFINKNYNVIILSSDNKIINDLPKKKISIINNKQIFFEPVLSQISKMFIGSASGFCNFANFSNIPYLIIKHPKHHQYSIDKQIKNNKLIFAKKKQFLLRSLLSYNKISRYIEKIEKN